MLDRKEAKGQQGMSEEAVALASSSMSRQSIRGWDCGSVVEYLPNDLETLLPLPNTIPNKTADSGGWWQQESRICGSETCFRGKATGGSYLRITPPFFVV